MATLILPSSRKALFGEGTLREHLKSQDIRSSYLIEEFAAWNPKDTEQVYGLSRFETANPVFFQEAYDWALGIMGSGMSTLLEIINSVQLVLQEDITLKLGDDTRPGKSLFFDAETPNGSLTFHLTLATDAGSPPEKNEYTNVWYIGKGDLFNDFTHIADTQLTQFISTAFLHEIRRYQKLGNLNNFPKMNFLAQRATSSSPWEMNPFEGRELKRHIALHRAAAASYEQVAIAATGDTVHWHKIGDGLSGASLVTRIRQGKVPGINPAHYKAKSVKDSSTGQFSVWVQYTTEPEAPQAPLNEDAMAQAAWERIEDKVRSLFIEEFKALL